MGQGEREKHADVLPQRLGHACVCAAACKQAGTAIASAKRPRTSLRGLLPSVLSLLPMRPIYFASLSVCYRTTLSDLLPLGGECWALGMASPPARLATSLIALPRALARQTKNRQSARIPLAPDGCPLSEQSLLFTLAGGAPTHLVVDAPSEFKRRGCIAVALHPGTVNTALSGPFQVCSYND